MKSKEQTAAPMDGISIPDLKDKIRRRFFSEMILESDPLSIGDEAAHSILIIQNPQKGRENLYLYFYPEKCTLIYGGWSIHFDYSSPDEFRLMSALDIILNQGGYVLTVSSDTLLFSCLIHGNRIFFSSDATNKINELYQNTEFLGALLDRTAHQEILTWTDES